LWENFPIKGKCLHHWLPSKNDGIKNTKATYSCA